MRPAEPAALRAVAARALGSIGGVRPVSLLRLALDAEEHIVRLNAAYALAAIGAPAREFLERLGDGPPSRRVMYAREAISASDLVTRAKAHVGTA
jgi:HEAT repeat protein